VARVGGREGAVSAETAPLRVAMIETGGWGGIAHYAWNLAQALRRAGADVQLLTRAPYELDGLGGRFTVERCFRPDVRYPRAAWMLARRLAALAPDVVHVQSVLSTRFDWLLWPIVRRRTAVVMTVHNVDAHEAGDRWAFWTQWRCLGAADGIIVHTAESRSRVSDRLGLGAPVALIHHGDFGFFADGVPGRDAARRRLDLPGEVPIVLAFGAIRPYKGLGEVIDALPRLRTHHPDARLVIAGPVLVGTAEEYRRAIAAAGVADAVIFRPGYVPWDSVATYFTAADVAVYNYEAVTDSGSLRIACALGTPVVATAVGGFREFLTDGVTARLVAPHDGAALVDAVSDVLAAPTVAARLAANARTLAGSTWSWPAAAEQTLALYREVLASRARRSLGRPRWRRAPRTRPT
jgi:glycosyltransferase involved in cell wall biosynthesis